jgi:hypothetical protein
MAGDSLLPPPGRGVCVSIAQKIFKRSTELWIPKLVLVNLDDKSKIAVFTAVALT